MKRGKSKMQSRKILLKSYAKSARARALKQKLAYQKQNYDGSESEED